MTIDDYRRILKNGSGVRISVWSSEVAEDNWYSLFPALDRLRHAGLREGIKPYLVVTTGGLDSRSEVQNSSKHLLPHLSWEELARRYRIIGKKLARKLSDMGWSGSIVEAWNEPDHHDYGGFKDAVGSPEWINGLSFLIDQFCKGVREVGSIRTAFAPFMTLNESKFWMVESVWRNVHQGCDLFSFHDYDDSPSEMYKNAVKMQRITVERPVIVTEHGNQRSPHAWNLYREQAWSFQNAFGQNLEKVFGYVAYSTHSKFVIDFRKPDDQAWKVTYDHMPDWI